MSLHDKLQLHDCKPTPLQREGLMRRADTYRAWVASGTVRRVDAEAMLHADAKQIGCDIDTDEFLAVQPRQTGPVAARKKAAGAAPAREGPDDHGERAAPVTTAVRAWRQ